MSIVADHIGVGNVAGQLPDVPCRRVILKLRNLGAAEVWIGDSDLAGTA